MLAEGPRRRYAELHQMIRDEAPWVFLWQQHDLHGVAAHVEWTPRADEKVWMYEAKIVARSEGGSWPPPSSSTRS